MGGCRYSYCTSWTNTPAKYLNRLEIRKKRSLVCKLRLGTLDLEIEKSRRLNIPRSERVCKICNSGEVEDVVHFILKCYILTFTPRTYCILIVKSYLTNFSNYISSFNI